MRVIELSSFYLLVASLLTAEVNLGPAGAVAIGLDSSVRHTSNVFLNSSEQSDIIYTLLPTVNYRSNQGAFELDAFMGIAMVHYSDFSSNNAENLKCGFNIGYSAGFPNLEVKSIYCSGLNCCSLKNKTPYLSSKLFIS